MTVGEYRSGHSRKANILPWQILCLMSENLIQPSLFVPGWPHAMRILMASLDYDICRLAKIEA